VSFEAKLSSRASALDKPRKACRGERGAALKGKTRAATSGF
jgi:hypothetical protein